MYESSGGHWALRVSALSAAAILAACGARQSVENGATWEVSAKTELARLHVGEGARLTAPAGRALSMTVDGIETTVAPGEYRGKIVLTPAADLDVEFDAMGLKNAYKYRVAAYIESGKLDQGRSVLSAVSGGTLTDSAATGVAITSNSERFNGIVVAGDTTYTITKPVIRFTGNGKNDFNGVGAGIRVGGTSQVTIDEADISNQGAVRSAIWVGENAVVTVNNAKLEVKDGELPKDYGWSWVTPGGGATGDVMMEVPWMLGLRGNARATLVVGSGRATYNNSRIKAQRWGAMSTDAVQEAHLTVNKSHVETVESGYGAYSDGNSMVTSNGSTWDVADYGFILSGGSALITEGSTINSRRFGVMAHGGAAGTLTIDKGSTINAEKAAIQLKGSSTTIVIDNATLISKRGLILQMMAHDDPNRLPGGVMGGGAPPGMLMPPPGKFNGSDGDNIANVTVRNAALSGDLLNSNSVAEGLDVALENSTLTGSISTATAVHDVGKNGEKIVLQESGELYYLIGEQTETLAATRERNGASVSVDGKSRWTVSKTSYLTGLKLADGAQLVAPEGSTLRLRVNGAVRPIAMGSYAGRIVLEVMPID